MQSRVNSLEAHLTERIDGLGGLEDDSVWIQFAEMRDGFDKLIEKLTIVSSPLAIDAAVF